MHPALFMHIATRLAILSARAGAGAVAAPFRVRLSPNTTNDARVAHRRLKPAATETGAGKAVARHRTPRTLELAARIE